MPHIRKGLPGLDEGPELLTSKPDSLEGLPHALSLVVSQLILLLTFLSPGNLPINPTKTSG
ncbi:MAG: hypothetical protein ABSA92_14840 [Candidatus Bathyarchaeia archaeon]